MREKAEVPTFNLGSDKLGDQILCTAGWGGCFQNSFSVARWQPSLRRRACLRVSRMPTVFRLLRYLKNHPFGTALRQKFLEVALEVSQQT